MSGVRRRVLEKVRGRLSTSPFIPITPPRSPVPHLLSSNGTPTDAEQKLIREAIADAEEKLAQLDQFEDSGVSKKSAKLRAACQDFIRAHKALLTPVRDLPPEILQEIFLLYSQTSTGFHRWIRLPFVLTQICHSWRVVALTIPGLWDKLPCFKLTPRTKSRSYTTFLEEILQRSGKAETLQIYVRAPFKEMASHPVINVLVRHSHRIQTLCIESGFTTVNAFILMKGKLPNLRQLELQFWTHQTQGTVDIFENAPRLTKVSVKGRCPPELALPWSQLTEFKERYEGSAVPKALLHGTNTLECLEIVKSSHHEVPAIPPTTLNALSSLSMRLDDPSEIAPRCLENFTLPSIKSVRIIFPGAVVPHLTTMLSHSPSSHTLRKLAFRSSAGALVLEELLSLFKLTPRLAELDMEVTDGEGAFLDLFVDLSTNPLTLPLLQSLSVHLRSTAGMEDVLNSIAGARCERSGSDMEHLVSDSDIDLALLDHVFPLKTFRVSLLSREEQQKSQASLNKWKIPGSSRQYRDAAKLETWRKEIIAFFPDFFSSPWPWAPTVPKKTKFPANWNRIFLEIENYISQDHIPLRVCLFS